MTRLFNTAMMALLALLAFCSDPEAHVPLELLRDAHCQVETQHLPESEKDTAISPKGAVGRCQIMPDTAKFLARKFKWDTEVDLFLREHSEALAHQRLIICRQSLRRRYGKATQRAISWCYLSGQISLWTPRRGFNGYYLDEIERKLEWVRRNRTNWYTWKIIPRGEDG